MNFFINNREKSLKLIKLNVNHRVIATNSVIASDSEAIQNNSVSFLWITSAINSLVMTKKCTVIASIFDDCPPLANAKQSIKEITWRLPDFVADFVLVMTVNISK